MTGDNWPGVVPISSSFFALFTCALNKKNIYPSVGSSFSHLQRPHWAVACDVPQH
jgi:hypothetical protein